MPDWTVTLELPECDGETPRDAVLDFEHQAQQGQLWVYRVENNVTHERFYVDMSSGKTRPLH